MKNPKKKRATCCVLRATANSPPPFLESHGATGFRLRHPTSDHSHHFTQHVCTGIRPPKPPKPIGSNNDEVRSRTATAGASAESRKTLHLASPFLSAQSAARYHSAALTVLHTVLEHNGSISYRKQGPTPTTLSALHRSASSLPGTAYL